MGCPRGRRARRATGGVVVVFAAKHVAVIIVRVDGRGLCASAILRCEVRRGIAALQVLVNDPGPSIICDATALGRLQKLFDPPGRIRAGANLRHEYGDLVTVAAHLRKEAVAPKVRRRRRLVQHVRVVRRGELHLLAHRALDRFRCRPSGV